MADLRISEMPVRTAEQFDGSEYVPVIYGPEGGRKNARTLLKDIVGKGNAILQTESLLKFLEEHMSDLTGETPYIFTPDEAKSIFGDTSGLPEKLENASAIRDWDATKELWTLIPIMYQKNDSTASAIVAAFCLPSGNIHESLTNAFLMLTVRDEEVDIILKKFPSNQDIKILPGSVRNLTKESTPEEIEGILGPASELRNTINNNQRAPIFVSGRWTQNNAVYASEVVRICYLSPNGGPYLFIIETDDLHIAIDSDITFHEYRRVDITDITPQTKTDNALKTSDKTIVGAINEVNGRAELMPVVTTVPELTDDYQIPANDTNTEKIYRIAIGETAYYITAADSVKWQNGIMPATSPNTTIVVSVIDNLATWGVF